MFPPLNANLLHLQSDVMGFLNEAQMRFPEAISLASGRPSAAFFDLRSSLEKFDLYVNHQVRTTGKTEAEILSALGQYNRAQGFVNEHMARYLNKDRNIIADAADIVVTVGAQEAMALVLMTMCDPNAHAIAIENPSYIGMSTFAKIAGYDIVPIHSNDDGLDIEELDAKILLAKTQGKPIRLLYTIPDHQNPTGKLMPLGIRHKLIEKAVTHDFYIIEDNAYGNFLYEGDSMPTIKSIDKFNRTIYIESFSKTLFPSLRMAALVAGQTFSYDNKSLSLSDQISKLKGYISLNTPAIDQAIFAGYLIENKYTFKHMTAPKVKDCMLKREAILAALEEHLGAYRNVVSWNKPKGGFFLTLKLPFSILPEDVTTCARDYGVIFCPMSSFYINQDKGHNEIRLAFSNVEPDKIKTAIYQLFLFIKSRINNQTT